MRVLNLASAIAFLGLALGAHAAESPISVEIRPHFEKLPEGHTLTYNRELVLKLEGNEVDFRPSTQEVVQLESADLQRAFSDAVTGTRKVEFRSEHPMHVLNDQLVIYVDGVPVYRHANDRAPELAARLNASLADAHAARLAVDAIRATAAGGTAPYARFSLPEAAISSRVEAPEVHAGGLCQAPANFSLRSIVDKAD